jgi:hypothetical protein
MTASSSAVITLSRLTSDLIAKLRDSQPVTIGFKPIYSDCVRALGTDPATGHFMSFSGIERARLRVCRHLNGIASGVQCIGCGANQTDDDGKCMWCGVQYRKLHDVTAALAELEALS